MTRTVTRIRIAESIINYIWFVEADLWNDGGQLKCRILAHYRRHQMDRTANTFFSKHPHVITESPERAAIFLNVKIGNIGPRLEDGSIHNWDGQYLVTNPKHVFEYSKTPVLGRDEASEIYEEPIEEQPHPDEVR